MAYTHGTFHYEEDVSIFDSTFDKSKEIEVDIIQLSHERMQKNWLRMLLYGFGLYTMSSDFDRFIEWLNDMYLDKKYDIYNKDKNNESYDLFLVRYTIQLLKNACTFFDEQNGLEGSYIPVKFFMLACIAREEHLKSQVLSKIDYNKQNPLEEKKIVDFFDFLKIEFNYILKSSFNEFNIEFMMNEFMTRVIMKHSGFLDLRESSAKVNSSNRTISNLNIDPRLITTSEETENVSNILNTTPEIPQQSNIIRNQPSSILEEHSRKLPLPKMYDPKYGSSQIAALAKRNSAISYYALICMQINFYMNHFYNTPLPKGLYYNAPDSV